MENEMSQSARIGRKRILLLFASMLILSITNIYNYQDTFGGDISKLYQQIIRFVLTVLLMWAILEGRRWAKILMTVLLTLAIILGIYAFFIPSTLNQMIPFIVMIFIYTLAVCYLNFSEDFKEYLEFKKSQ